jgi:hypothetical protein
MTTRLSIVRKYNGTELHEPSAIGEVLEAGEGSAAIGAVQVGIFVFCSSASILTVSSLELCMAGPPMPNNRRERRNTAQELAKEFIRTGVIPGRLSMGRLMWSWPVVGGVLFLVLGGAITFMSSSHPIVADIFFVAGSALFIAKFLSWEDAKRHAKRKAITVIVMFMTAALTVGAMWGSHRMNAPPEPEYHTVADRHLTLGRLMDLERV